MVQALRKAGIDYVENLRSTTGTRAVVGALAFLLDYLLDPKNSPALANTYRVWRRDDRGDEEAERGIANIVTELRKIANLEDFLWPRTSDWLDDKVSSAEQPDLYNHLARFSRTGSPLVSRRRLYPSTS